MSSWKDVEKDLVAEQPGLGLSFIGLFLAFFMGLALRAAVSPDRVHEHITKATEKVHRELQFNFGRAYVSFSRGFWPDLSVVVEDISIQSQNACWLTPLAEINEIRLPLSIRHLFRGEILIHEVLADEVNLSLRTPMSECDNLKTADLTTPLGPAPAPVREIAQQLNQEIQSKPTLRNLALAKEKDEAANPPVMGNFKNVRRKNPIDFVKISQLRIHYLPIAFTSFYIFDVQASLKSEDPRWIQLLGRLNLEGDSLLSEANAHADLLIDVVEGDQPSVNATAKGVWREGHYEILARLDSKTQNLFLEADVKHLPLSRLFPLLRKYRWMESDFNGRQAWISGHLKAQGPLAEIRNRPARLSGLRLEGDLGEITCAQAEIEQWSPLQFQPMDFEIHGLNIKELLTFLNRPHPSPTLGDLGIFNGRAHFVSPEQLQLRGDYSGLEFIFSNRGSRQIQTLSLVSGELELQKNQWQIQIDRIKPVEGIFDGKVSMTADKDFKEIKLGATITELGLAPKIQTLMTGGGSLGALSGELKVDLKAAQISNLSGQLKWDQLLIEGVRITKPKVTLKTVGAEVHMDFASQEMEMQQASMAAPYFVPLFEDLGVAPLVLKNPSGEIRTHQFSTLSWRNVQAMSPRGPLKSTGAWNKQAVLSGEIQILSRPAQTWLVQGTRSQPQFVVKKP